MTIDESMQRVLENRDTLATLFYEIFFQRYPEVQAYFKDVNMKHQAVLLTMSLMVVERHYAHHYASTALYLKYLGHKHRMRSVPIDFYPRWIDALLAALERYHGTDWDQETAGQWRQALEQAAEAMLAGYREPVHV